MQPTNQQALQKQEPKPLKNGKALLQALRSTQLQCAYDADIKMMLKYVMMKIGIRANNIPDDIEKQVLVDHIKTNFPNNTLDEIRLAFDMAINEDLDINPDDVKAYENFSCAYFSRIMNAYLSWAANEIKFLKHEPPPQRIYTDEENDNLHRELTEEFYQRLRRGMVEEIPDYAKWILLKDGLIKDITEANNFFVYRLGKQQQNIYQKVK